MQSTREPKCVCTITAILYNYSHTLFNYNYTEDRGLTPLSLNYETGLFGIHTYLHTYNL